MMAWPDQRRTQEALANLDLLVTTDVWYSPTARVADYGPEQLDRLCLSGRVAWGRLTPGTKAPLVFPAK